MTVSVIRKSIDQQMENLTPAELAKYIVHESKRIAEQEATGKDVSEDDTELEKVYNKYVISRDIYDYAAFWRAMHDEERNYWGQYFLGTVYPGIVREHALVGLLIIEKIKVIKRTNNISKNSSDNIKAICKMISELMIRYRKLGREIKLILDENELWDRFDVEKPNSDDFCRNISLIEDLVEDIFCEYQ